MPSLSLNAKGLSSAVADRLEGWKHHAGIVRKEDFDCSLLEIAPVLSEVGEEKMRSLNKRENGKQ